jgi:hypothetical protein
LLGVRKSFRSILTKQYTSQLPILETPPDLRGSYNLTYGNLRGQIQPMAKYAYWVEVLPYRHTVGQSHYLQGAVDESSSRINRNFGNGLSDSLKEIARSAGGY